MKHDQSIRRTLMLITLVTSCGAVLAATAILLMSEYWRSEAVLERRVSVLAQVIGMNSGPAILFDDVETAEETLAALAVEAHIQAAVLYDTEGSAFASYVRPDVAGFVIPTESPSVGGHLWQGDHLDVGEEIVSGRERVGSIFIRSDTAEMSALLQRFALIGLAMVGLATIVSWLGASWLKGRIADPLIALAEGSEQMAGGDLSVRVERYGDGEIGTLSSGFNRMAESLAGLVARVRGNARSVTDVTLRLQESSDSMLAEANRQQCAVEETTDSIERMSRSIDVVNENVETLATTASDTSGAALEMDAAIEGIASHVDELSLTIDMVGSSVVQMTSAIGEIARGADSLNNATSSTSASLNLLNRSVTEVERAAEQSHALAARSSEQAERGVQSVQQTVEGIRLIQRSFRGLEEIIGRLEDKSQSIGEVVKVIEGVVEQTNLLALNAAIISSHAGEHGRAFAVVAQEVKSLADRTALSTREIADLINGVQLEVSDAVAAMSMGSGRVEKGVALSTEAGEILSAIGKSAQESIQMANDIVRATGAQSGDIQRVEGAMTEVADIAKQLNRGTHEQDSAGAEITRGVERMRQLGQEVKRSTQEQRKESQRISESVEIVSGRIGEILESTTSQTEQAGQILQALQVFREVTEQSSHRAEDMKRTVHILYTRAEELRQEVGRFNL